MDSGNSGSISSSDDEYDSSHADPLLLNHFGSISHSQPSLVPSHPSIFDLSSTYLHSLSTSHPHNSFFNLDPQGQRSEPNCTLAESLPYSSSATNQCFYSGHDNFNNNARQLSSPQPQTNNLVRNSKKRSRASRRAPTTVLTTDTTNFRSMVQEFTGIPAPPFSPSFSRRRPNPSLLSTSSRTTLLHNSTNINVSPNNNSFSYQLLADPSLPYQSPQNLMQNHPPPTFNTLHSLIPGGFGAKCLSMPSLDGHLVGSQGHHHEHVVSEGMLLRSNEGDGGGRRDPFTCLDGINNHGGSCKLNMSVSGSSSLNHEKNLENADNSPREAGGAVEAWICSSDHQ